jgi:hypothetical protein
VQNIENVGHEAAQQSRHRYRQFGKDEIELSLGRRNSDRSAVRTVTSDREDNYRTVESGFGNGGRPDSSGSADESMVKRLDTPSSINVKEQRPGW